MWFDEQPEDWLDQQLDKLDEQINKKTRKLAMTQSTYSQVPIQGNCRWFLRRGATVRHDRGFRSKQDASDWIDSLAIVN